MLSDSHQFFILTEFFITLIGAVILLAFWSMVGTHFKYKLSQEIEVKRLDKGLLFFGLAVLVWSVSDLTRYFIFTEDNAMGALISSNVFSILNSMFLIFALFYLDNAPAYLYNNKKSSTKIILALVSLSILSFIITMVFKNTDLNATPSVLFGLRFNAIPDLILSAVLSWFLLVSLYRTFHNREMNFIAVLSVVSVLLLFVSQLPEVFYFKDFIFQFDLLKIIAKTSIISMFMVLGTSWVIDIALTPTPTDMKIHFADWNRLILTIPSKGMMNQTIEFGNKTTQFNNLLKFAIRRKYAPEHDMCIEIVRGGELSSQTYLSRIVDNINEILHAEENNKLIRNDLFTFIGQGKYRLRFLPSHIIIDEALLNEFVHNIDNESYKSFVSNHNQ